MHTPRGPVLNETTLADIQALGDDMLGEIVALFVVDSSPRMMRLHAAFVDHAADAIRREAHGLKGGALGIGAARMADICQAIEHYAAQGHIDQAAALEDAIAPAFDEARGALEALCGSRSTT